MALNIHQSTVCRSLQLLQRQLRLVSQPGARVCRYGHNSCLEHLRLAYREHRLMEGLLRIGSDVLHQSLLLAMPGVQRVPPRFRSLGHWLELLRQSPRQLIGVLADARRAADLIAPEAPLADDDSPS